VASLRTCKLARQKDYAQKQVFVSFFDVFAVLQLFVSPGVASQSTVR
jgi:hypothetical protein